MPLISTRSDNERFAGATDELPEYQRGGKPTDNVYVEPVKGKLRADVQGTVASEEEYQKMEIKSHSVRRRIPFSAHQDDLNLAKCPIKREACRIIPYLQFADP